MKNLQFNGGTVMGKLRNNEKGFAAAEGILIVVVVILVGVAGYMAYRNHHKTTANKTTASTTAAKTTTTPATVDPYAGWKTYCDAVYKYCFKYPDTWSLQGGSVAKVGDSGQTTLLSPTKAVEVDYINAFVHDGGTLDFNTLSIDKLTAANQDLTVVGGYYATSGAVGNYFSSYHVVDTSLLQTYPLVTGQSSSFSNNPTFQDKDIDGNYRVTFRAQQAVTINTVADAKAWFNSGDAQTGLKILKTIYKQ